MWEVIQDHLLALDDYIRVVNEAMSKLSEAVAQDTRVIEHLVNLLDKVK